MSSQLFVELLIHLPPQVSGFMEETSGVLGFIRAMWTSIVEVASSKAGIQVGLGVLTVILGIVLAWAIRWLRRKMFVEFDRSILVRVEIADDENPVSYANWPILVGPLPFASFGGRTVPNVQVKDVVGFIVGAPVCIKNPEEWNLPGWEPGYFAYGIIHWERFDEIRAFIKRGHYLQQTFLPDSKGNPVKLPESRFLRFVTDSPEQQGVADSIEGMCASLRFKPYAKLGFESSDLAYRRLSLQLSLILWLGKNVNRIARWLGKPYHRLWQVLRWIRGKTRKFMEREDG